MECGDPKPHDLKAARDRAARLGEKNRGSDFQEHIREHLAARARPLRRAGIHGAPGCLERLVSLKRWRMKSAIIRSSWMEGYGYRLDCSPYLGGALEAKILLEKLPLRKDKLQTLTSGFDGGIYNGPQFVRRYVESSDFGVPFITGSSLRLADLSHLALLSKRDALGPNCATWN